VNRESLALGALVAVLLVVGGLAWWLELGPVPEAEPSSLAALPTALEGWKSYEIPLEQTVEAMLRADYNVQRAYVHPIGDVVWLYVGYYGTRRGGTPEHTPGTCYVANGWEVRESRVVEVPGLPDLRVREYVVSDGSEERLVHFWYRTYRSTGLTSVLRLNFDHLVGRLLANRADGALIRLSTPMPRGERRLARARLLVLDVAVERALHSVWPREVVPRASATAGDSRHVALAPPAR